MTTSPSHEAKAMKVVLIDCDFCGARGVPWGGIIVGSVAETRWHYCQRCCKPGRAYKDALSFDDAERLRLRWRLAATLREVYFTCWASLEVQVEIDLQEMGYLQ